MMHNTNPFDDGNDNNTAGKRARRDGEKEIVANDKVVSTSASLFPVWLSSWMTKPPQVSSHNASPSLEDYDDALDDDESLYHDCLSKIDTSDMDDISSNETTSLLAKTTRHSNQTSQSKLSPLRQRSKFYNATTSATPIRSNTSTNSSGRDIIIDATPQNNNIEHSNESIYSPLSQALATWLSPYADSAKRAGRNILYFSEEESPIKYISSGDEHSSNNNQQHSYSASDDDESSSFVNDANNANNNAPREVRFHPDYKNNNNIMRNGGERSKRNGYLSRAISSPALLTTISLDETTTWNSNINDRAYSSTTSTIVLKDIDMQGESSDSEENGIVIHPWTKLILLEELGTAWSWFVLLLPYIFLILAVFLDGYAQLKNITVGPLNGNRTCADMVLGSVPTPFDKSVKGYYPVPFRFEDGHSSIHGSNRTTVESKFNGSCTYPFELREGVGLLSHGKDSEANSTLLSTTSARTSIINARYRYLMSHGHAFTSGVISNVPPTSQSLRGSVKFNNVSSNAVALVARGSVMVSAIVFQRPNPSDSMGNSTVYTSKQWSPVLILSSKRLDMVCNLNVDKYHDNDKHDATTWTCSSRRIIDAFFSLPNTAVLMGGDLRVDILLSHHKGQKSLLTGDLWGAADDDYVINDVSDDDDMSEADKILYSADTSHPQQLLLELSTKSVYKLEHQSIAYSNIVEATRIFSLTVTLVFIFVWWWSMGIMNEDSESEIVNEEGTHARAGDRRILPSLYKFFRRISHRLKRDNHQQNYWWHDHYMMFPERRFLLLLLFCLILLQNPLLTHAFFHPSLYSSAKYRLAADSLSGISVHGILFLWLCLVHGLRYHTADIARRRLAFHSRVLELRKATSHISPSNDVEDTQWGRVNWYYQQYGDVDGGGTAALRMKHDVSSDSFVEFMFPKVVLLFIGIVASISAAASRFPMAESSSMSQRIELNPDRFGSGSKVYVLSSIIQIIVINIWCVFIVYTSFVTGERLKREPFLSTRPAQLAFRVLSGILLLGVGFSIALFYFHSLNLIGNVDSTPDNADEVLFDTSLGGSSDESWNSRADLLLTAIRRATAEIPYVGTASSLGPGKLLYATACSLVVAHIFLPSSHFNPSKKEQKAVDEIVAMGPDQYSKQTMLSDMDKRYQGKDKRFVVALARNTHTWRVFPLPTRSHGLMSQHTLKEQLNIIGTFQLNFDGRHFNMHKFKFGRGAIYKGRYIPVFCVELACWLLEASWQAYYSPTEYSLNTWAPGRMSLDSIGLKLEKAINDAKTDTHAFVASNISEQVEGEDDSIIVVAFRGSASISNVKTDLSFRQVPLPEKITSDMPAFNIRPGMPIAVDETLWDTDESSLPSVLQDILHGPSGKYISWPTTATESFNANHPAELDQSVLLPTVSNGAKAIIRATPMARQALPCVHEGFLENYSKIRHETIESIISVLKRQLDKSVERSKHGSQPLTLPKIYITGHSMGGSLAQLLALDLASNCEIIIEQALSKNKGLGCNGGSEVNSKQSLSSLDIDDDVMQGEIFSEFDWLGQNLNTGTSTPVTPTKKIRLRPPIAVYTYGQSRVGNNAFKTIYKKRVPHTFRVCTEGDAVTSQPAVGPFCGGVYRHAGLEVLLEEGCTGNILVGPTVVETLLRFTKVRTSMAAHSMDRYRESLESALGKDDLKEYYRGHGGKVRHDNQMSGYPGNGGSLPSWVTNVKRSHDV